MLQQLHTHTNPERNTQFCTLGYTVIKSLAKVCVIFPHIYPAQTHWQSVHLFKFLQLIKEAEWVKHPFPFNSIE